MDWKDLPDYIAEQVPAISGLKVYRPLPLSDFDPWERCTIYWEKPRFCAAMAKWHSYDDSVTPERVAGALIPLIQNLVDCGTELKKDTLWLPDRSSGHQIFLFPDGTTRIN